MSIPRVSLLLAALIAIAFASPSEAGVYKCIDKEGGITFAQTPCPAQESTEVTTISATPAAGAEMQCDHAAQFSLAVARSMKRGRRSADLYSEFGGFDALSKSAVNIINYVYMFQHSTDVSEQRIAELAGSKCKAHAFGNVRCEALPAAYTDSVGSCDDSEKAAEPDARLAAKPLPSDSTLAFTRAESESINAGSRAVSADALSLRAGGDDGRDDCRSRIQTKIDSINSRMRAGYSSSQGEQYRKRLRSLRSAKSDC